MFSPQPSSWEVIRGALTWTRCLSSAFGRRVGAEAVRMFILRKANGGEGRQEGRRRVEG